MKNFIKNVEVVCIGATLVWSTYQLGKLAMEWAEVGLENLHERKTHEQDIHSTRPSKR